MLRGWLGDRAGRWLYDRVRGIDASPVHRHAERKSLSHEETFSRDLDTDEALDRELLRLALRVAADLRAKRLATRTITVKLRDTDFTTRQASRTLRRPVSTDRPILTTARHLLRKLRRSRRVPARLLGVGASMLFVDAQEPQFDLFQSDEDRGLEDVRDRALARVIDDINLRYGRHAIHRGAVQANRSV